MTLLSPDLRLTGQDNIFVQRAAMTHAGMAHLAGSGPLGTQCKQCSFFTEPTKVKGRCNRYSQLCHGRVGPIFPADAATCRHFEKR